MNHTNPRLAELISRYLDARLTADEEAELLALLEDPASQAYFLELVRVHGEIGGLLMAPVSDEAMAAMVQQDIESALAEEADGELLEPVVSVLVGGKSRDSARRFAGRVRARWWVAMAAALLVACGFLWLRQESLPPEVARIEQARGSVFAIGPSGRRAVESGEPLRAGEELVTLGDDSLAVVAYPDTSRLELASNTMVSGWVDLSRTDPQGNPDKRVVLTQGAVWVQAARQAAGHPMIVISPHAEVAVLGTRFLLESAEDSTSVTVSHGAVQCTRKEDQRSIELAAGTFAVASPGGEPFVAQPTERSTEIPVSRGIRLGRLGGWAGLSFGSDGKFLAGCTWSDGRVRLWPLEGKPSLSGEEAGGKKPSKESTEFAGATGALWSVSLSPDGRTLAAGGVDKKARLWDVRSRELLGEMSFKDHVRAVAFAPDGLTLAVGSFDSTVKLCDPRTGAERTKVQENDRGGWAGIYALSFSPDSRWLAAGLSDRRVRVREVASGDVHHTLAGHSSAVVSVAFSPDGKSLATGSKNEVIVWDAATGDERYRLSASAPVAFAPDGSLLGTGGASPALWDAAQGRERARLQGHRGEVYALAFSPDGKWLGLGGWQGIILLPGTGLEGVSWSLAKSR